MRVRAWTGFVVFAALALLAGCGGDNLEFCPGCGSPTPTVTVTPTPTATASAATPSASPTPGRLL